MKKSMSLLLISVLILLTLLPFATGDGIPFPPRKAITYDFSAIKERQQYAVVDVKSNYFEQVNLYLALSSLDFEEHNTTIIIPLKSIPQDVDSNRITEKEFLSRYEFDGIRDKIGNESFGEFIKKVDPKTRILLEDYLLSSVFSPLHFLSRIKYLGYGPIYAEDIFALGGTRTLPSGVTYIKRFEFEGGYMDIYGVESGQTLENFLKEYQLEIPGNVKESVDRYNAYYIAVLNLEIKPIADISLLKEYAPNTLKEAIEYIRENPDFSFTCTDYGYYYDDGIIYEEYLRTSKIAPPARYRCDEREIIKQKFNEFIVKAVKEAKSKKLDRNYTERYNLEISPLIEDMGGYWKLYDHDTICGDPGQPCYSSENITIHFGTKDITTLTFNIGGSDWRDVDVYASRDNLRWTKVNSFCCYPSGDHTIDVSNYSSDLYLTFILGTGSCCGENSYVTLGKKFKTNVGTIDLQEGYQDPILSKVESAMIDFFLSAYSNKTKGTEISMTLPIKNNQVFYPLGTGMAWSTPIEDTKILVKMDKNLEVNFEHVQSSTIYKDNRYYFWEFKNWNPNYDIIGSIKEAGFGTWISDSFKSIIRSMNKNSGAFAWFFAFLAVLTSVIVTSILEKGRFLKNIISSFLTAILAPFFSLWIILLLQFSLKTKPGINDLKILLRRNLILFGLILIFWCIFLIVEVVIK